MTTLGRSRLAINFAFFINGIIFGGWAANIPSIKSKFGLTEASIGGLLLTMSIGAVLVMIITASWVNRYGSRGITIASALIFTVTLIGLFITPSLTGLFILAFFFGAGNGSLDVAMNNQAIILEQEYQRPIMSSIHGMSNVGGFMAAITASLILSAGGTVLHQALGLCITIFALSPILFLWLIKKREETPVKGKKGKLRFNPILMVLSILALITFMSEGIVFDWSALYMRDIVNTNEAKAALAYGAFSATMMIGRFSGDYLVARFDKAWMLRVGGLLSATGISIALLFPNFIASLAGFALAGLGLSNLVPILFSRAGNLPNIASSTGIAAVSISGYGGFLIGPALIGSIAHVYSLTFGLSLLILFGLITTTLAGLAINKQ